MVQFSYKDYLEVCKKEGYKPHSYLAKSFIAQAKEASERMLANRRTIEEFHEIHLSKSDKEAVYTLTPGEYEELYGMERGTERYIEEILGSIAYHEKEERKANEERIHYMIEALDATEMYNTNPRTKAKCDFIEREIMNIKMAYRQ